MKKTLWLLALGGLATACSNGTPPSTLAYSGSYPEATVLVTIIGGSQGFTEYTIVCSGDSAEIDGNDSLNPTDACASLANSGVQARLFGGRDDSRACTNRAPEDGELQFMGLLDGVQINTFIDRENSCGRQDWDSLFAYIAASPAETK